VEAGELQLAVRSVGRYRARDGSVVEVDPEPDAQTHDLTLYLSGVMLGTILHQRGAFPLHACCVAIGGEGVALSGPSGIGKSTLASLLTSRGARFVADDVAVLTELAGGRVGVWPGPARLKLDQPALDHLGVGSEGLDGAGGTRAKFHLPVTTDRRAEGSVPLRRVYLIETGTGAPRTEIVRGLEAVAALVDAIYFLSYAVALDLAPQCFRLAATAAAAIEVRRLIRPPGFRHLEAVADLISAEAEHDRNPGTTGGSPP
jgi:hypothetical protein